MSLLPKQYLDAVVSIETPKRGKNLRFIATGFLVGFSIDQKDQNGRDLFRIFLVTNRHVFKRKKQVVLRFNATNHESKRFPLILRDKEGQKWFSHPNRKVDVAVIPINIDLLKKQNIQFFWFPEPNVAFKSTINKLGITQGDEIFIIGFPMGITGIRRNYAITRSGIIARLDDEIINSTFQFLIDAFIFPGSSGSPVVLKPSVFGIRGTKPVNKAYLLGVAKGYIPYREVAISPQTKELRAVFVENSGLAGVVPMDFVKEIVAPLLKGPEQKT